MNTHTHRNAAMFGLLALATLALAAAGRADAPAPRAPELRYALPATGTVAIAIDDADGRRVRHLLAEAGRAPGEHVETWDGRDDAGRLVPPGDYTFRGAFTPPLGLKYEFTLNNAGTVPWWRNVDNGNPMREKGGWMSDHSPPTDVATLSNLVFLAADATEHGNSLNVIDLDGKQVWATRWLGLAGARFVATDTRWAYVGAEGAWMGKNFKLFVLSPRSFEFRELAGFNFEKPQGGRGGGLSGLAAHGGKVAVAFNGKLTDAMSGSLSPDALDAAATTLRNLQPAQAAAILRLAEPAQPWVSWPLPEDKVLRLAWKEPRAVGSVLSPHLLDVATLRPEAVYPGDPARESDWEPLDAGAASAVMNVYTAPGGRQTRGLRIRVKALVSPRQWAEPEGARTASTEPATQFAGLRIVSPPLRDRSAGAAFAASSGTVFPGGAWDNVQAADIATTNPAVYTVTLPAPAVCRALVVRDPFFLEAEVEVQAAAGGPWVTHGTLTATLPWRRAYTEATFDFHRDTPVAALRLKVTRPATDQNADAKKRTGGRANVCSLGGVVMLGAGPNDPPVPPDLGQRVEVYSADDGKLLKQLPVAAPGALEFTPDGRLVAISGTQVVHVPLDGAPPVPVIASGPARPTDPTRPTGLTIASDGTLFVADSGDHTVKQFTPAGEFVRIVGKPGGLDVGPYDPAHMSNPWGLALDARGRLWVAEHELHPKKVSVWTLGAGEPTLDAYYIGGPPYGGGFMYPDPRNPSRFFFQGMEFEADWETGNSRLKNILWRGGKGLSWNGVLPGRPIYLDNRLYLVADPHCFYGGSYYAVARYDAASGQAVPVAAAGQANGAYSMGVGGPWPPLQDPHIRNALGLSAADNPAFAWSDLNGDGCAQADEIRIDRELRLDRGYAWSLRAGNDLALQFGRLCLAPAEFTADGVPVYTFAQTRPTPATAGPPTVPYGDNYHGMGLTRDDQIIELSSVISVQPRAGAPAWTYSAPWPGTQLSGKAPPPRPGLVAGQLGVIGTALLPDAGEVFACVGDKGEIYIFTTDGLFVARLFRDNRYGKSWNFPEARRGMEVGGVSINGEHFGGTFTQMADGRILLVVGHNHNSVVRVEGLDGIRRFSGRTALTAAQYVRFEAELARGPATNAAPLALNVSRAPEGGLVVDGALTDWPAAAFTDLQGAGEHAGRVAMMWDAKRLLLAYAVRGRPRMENGGTDWTLLFKSGDSVDLQLGTDPRADAQRGDPAPGDLRLSLSMFEGRPVAVRYRYRAPDAPEQSRRTFASPVGSVTVDAVERVDAEVRVVAGDGGYTVEAAIPWSSLGATPPTPGAAWRGDLGILFATESGGAVAERLYWANRDTGLVVDLPGEIRLRPRAWGTVTFE